MSPTSRRAGGLLLAALAGTAVLAPSASAENAVAVTSYAPQSVVQFDTATPGTLTSTRPVLGLRSKELIFSIDYRPASGQVLATTNQGRLLELQPGTGATTAVDADTVPEITGATDAIGFDVNPAVDRLRFIDGQRRNVRIASGSLAQARPTVDTSITYTTGGDVEIGGAAYTNSVPDPASTELYVLDSGRNLLGRVASPNAGVITPIGPIGVNTTAEVGFDISGATGDAYAILTPSSPRRSNLYRVNLATGATSLVGGVGLDGRYRALTLAPAVGATDTVDILFNNDPESRLRRFAETGTGALYGGAARHVQLFQQLASQAGGRTVLRLNGGDNFLAGVDFQASLDKSPRVPFYDAIALNRIGFDGLAIGNHEFDFGPDVFAEFLAGFTGGAKFVSSNLDVSGEPSLEAFSVAGQLIRRTVVEKAGVRYGIVGATTTDLASISSPGNATVSAAEAAIQSQIDALQADSVQRIFLVTQLQGIANDRSVVRGLTGVDVVVSGGGQETQSDEGAASANAPAEPGQLVPGDTRTASIPGVAGSTLDFPYTTRNRDGAPVKIVTTNGLYKYVGRLTVRFDAQGRVVGHDEQRSRPFRVSGNTADPDVIAEDAFTRDNVRIPLESYVAGLAATELGTSEVALDGRRANLRTREVNEGNLVADALLFEGRRQAAAAGDVPPTIALQNSGGLRNDSLIPAGSFSRATAFAIAPFANFLATVQLTPQQLKNALELGVGRWPAVDGRFPQVAGLRFSFSTSGVGANPTGTPSVPISAGTRIRSVVLEDGTPGPSAGDVTIVDNGVVQSGGAVPSTIVMATNDFTARGGDDYPLATLPREQYPVSYLQALERFVSTPVASGGLARDGLDITAAEYPLAGQGRIVQLP